VLCVSATVTYCSPHRSLLAGLTLERNLFTSVSSLRPQDVRCTSACCSYNPQMIQTARNWFKYSKKKLKILTRIRGSKSKREADMTDGDNKRHCLYTSQSQSIAGKEQGTESKEGGPIDPISLEVIDPNRITMLNGICYDHVTLIQFFVSTLNFHDPLSMCSLTEDQVIELDMKSFSFMMHLNDCKEGMKLRSHDVPKIDREVEAVALALDLWPFVRGAARPLPIPPTPPPPSPKQEEKTNLDLQLPPLLPLYRKQAADVTLKKAHMSTIHTLESICGGLVEEIYDLVEEDGKQESQDFNYLFMRIVSEFDYAWRELKTMDPQAAYMALQSYKNFLSGSQKKPTPDPRHRLRYVLMVLESALWSTDDNNRHINDRKERSQSYDMQSVSVAEITTEAMPTSPRGRGRTQSMT
jgi:hypothetical protein